MLYDKQICLLFFLAKQNRGTTDSADDLVIKAVKKYRKENPNKILLDWQVIDGWLKKGWKEDE